MNPYHSFVSSLARLVVEGKSLPLGGFPVEGRPATKADAPVALLFSPHPDDECIVGGLALRLMREAGLRVINVAVTLGSNAARQLPRREELQKAC
ncbi:MAG: PIG-L family deacetylase, partial [Akkermansiaceae bacterium]|nr:PIG-L family deacetylase [Verrucomicrobiales bacterium]